MIYRFIANRAKPFALDLPSDLSARRTAETTTDTVRVETNNGRVVWRRCDGTETGNDGDLD